MRLDRIVERLQANAGIVSALAGHVSDEQAGWKPAPDKWSIVEVVTHLADEEVEDFRTRVDFTLHRPGEGWPAIDPRGWVDERAYRDQPLKESLARFLRNRAESLAWLGTLDSPDWTSAHQPPGLEPITAGDLLISWVGHDFIHIRQLNRLHREFFLRSVPEFSADYAGRW